ncbi:DUF3152 domain-containing protein [Streptomyces sp. NPDC090022]|uniref:DUF3152 domain-containing protein n=1 Tax=Streptomyces sp. NPDC090022 TaxID=3365920 RepID=UPI00381F9FBA
MGRHSRKDPAPARPASAEPAAADRPRGRRRRTEPPTTHQGYAPPPAPGARAGHPQMYESGGAWGTGPTAPAPRPAPAPDPAAGAVYGDWRGVPRSRPAGPAPASPSSPSSPSHPSYGGPGAPSAAQAALLDTGVPPYDAPPYETPAAGYPQVKLPSPRREAVPPRAEAGDAPYARSLAFMDSAVSTEPAGSGGAPADPVTSTGSHRRVPAPRPPAEEPPATGRGSRARTYTGMAAAAVTTALAVVVALQVTAENDTRQPGTLAADDGAGRAAPQRTPVSRSEDRATPEAAAPAPQPAAPKTYEQLMAEVFPLDAGLKGPNAFDAVRSGAKAPGKGRLVRYRVDVEQGLGLDADLFAEAVHRTLNDPRSWSHDGAMTFERVTSGETKFVITLASPGTTGIWCAKSDLDTTVDNVSCDSGSTERVMINAFRWAQGSATFGQDQMFAYRQMLINHEVGHRLGHGHVNCKTPGALAPVMQQQTKSLEIDGVRCKANPWVFPDN